MTAPDLSTAITAVLAAHKAQRLGEPASCSCGWKMDWRLIVDDEAGIEWAKSIMDLFHGHVASMLAPVIREREAEASAQAFQAVRDNAEHEPEERDGVYLISPATLWIDVDKLNALDKSHDGMDWIRFTATDYANEMRKAQAVALREVAHELGSIPPKLRGQYVAHIQWRADQLEES